MNIIHVYTITESKAKKWGVRRYQNPDGTLTSAGKKRYLNEMQRDMDQHFKSQLSGEAAKVASMTRGEDTRGSAWSEAYRKGKVTSKDDAQIKKAIKATNEYAKAKYGESAYKAMKKSGSLGRPIDDFDVKFGMDFTNKHTKKKDKDFEPLVAGKDVSSVTKRVINDYNTLDEAQFRKKTGISKKEYRKRVEKYGGDPYMNSPMAKYAKSRKNRINKRYDKKINKIQKDIDSFKGHENGIYDNNGRMLLSKEDVQSSVQALQKEQDKIKAKKNKVSRSI